MGVSIIVNFRDERDETAAEQREVESLGMKYVGIPWSGGDNPSSAQVGIGRGETDGRSLWSHFYAQDDWRPSPRVTLNLGVRYEINGQMVETGNRFSNPELNRFVIASGDRGTIHPDAAALLPLIPVPYVTSKDAGYDRSLQTPSYSRVAPRIGFAWSPGSSDRFVIRSGFGLFYNQAAYSITESLALNLPFYFNKSITLPVDQAVPVYTTNNILLAPNTGSISRDGKAGLITAKFAGASGCTPKSQT